MLLMQSNGISAQMQKQYFPKSDKCRADADPETTVDSMRLGDLSVMFFILGLGLSLSFAAFFAELIHSHRDKKKSRPKSFIEKMIYD